MNTTKGFAGLTVLLVALGIIVLGGGAYVAMNLDAAKTPAAEDDGVQTASGDRSEEKHDGTEGVVADSFPEALVSWNLETEGVDAYGKPSTKVSAVVEGKVYVVGTYDGTCSVIGETGGAIYPGVDGGGLLAGELSAVQCWWGGGGNEIGVFAHEDGGYQIMVGALDEGSAELPGFRGDFEISTDIRP